MLNPLSYSSQGYFLSRIFFFLIWPTSNVPTAFNSILQQLFFPAALVYSLAFPKTHHCCLAKWSSTWSSTQNFHLVSFYTHLGEILASLIKIFPTAGTKPVLHNSLHVEYSLFPRTLRTFLISLEKISVRELTSLPKMIYK